jgi:hypothetical protein
MDGELDKIDIQCTAIASLHYNLNLNLIFDQADYAVNRMNCAG